MTTLETNIPFAGFYNSLYSDAIDREEEQFVEYRLQDGDISYEQADELMNLLFRHTNYTQAYCQLAQDYTTAFNEKFKERTGVDLGLRFVTMTSPREYNFETDRIFARAYESALITLRMAVNEDVLKAKIRKRFTSRSGFISFYSNNLADWPEELCEWDHNQLCTLLMYFLPEDWDWDMYYATTDSEQAYRAWEAAVNWKEIDAFLAECKETENE